MLTTLQEATHVRYIAEHSRPSTECPYITHLDYRDYTSDVKLARDIDKEIAKGSPVVLKGYEYKQIEMNTESIHNHLAISPKEVFDVTGMC